ncbi:MAG: hemerythrin domain-containing protein [Bryobacterales bacterium]|nr:hemerythrin domain-containing protein [Bryobacterales bacterium]
MKRDASLIPLSHQHHNGLALCVLVTRSLDADSSDANIARQAAKIVDRFEIELVNHFALEEEFLFPLLTEHPLTPQLIAEHRQMEAAVDGLRSQPSREAILAFVELLRTHIRREENELFQDAQSTLSRADLDRLGAEMDRLAVRVCL